MNINMDTYTWWAQQQVTHLNTLTCAAFDSAVLNGALLQYCYWHLLLEGKQQLDVNAHKICWNEVKKTREDASLTKFNLSIYKSVPISEGIEALLFLNSTRGRRRRGLCRPSPDANAHAMQRKWRDVLRPGLLYSMTVQSFSKHHLKLALCIYSPVLVSVVEFLMRHGLQGASPPLWL